MSLETKIVDTDPGTQQAEALATYQESLEAITHVHISSLQEILDTHGNGFAAWEPGNTRLENVIVGTHRDVEDMLGTTATAVERALKDGSEELSATLDPDNSHLLEEARRFGGEYSVLNERITKTLNSITNPTVRSVVNAALDADRLRDARRFAQERGVESEEVNRILESSSSPVARAAISAAIDQERLKDIHQLTSISVDYTPDNERIGGILDGSSSPTARAAIEAALEKDQLEIARLERGDFDPFDIKNLRGILTFGVQLRRPRKYKRR